MSWSLLVRLAFKNLGPLRARPEKVRNKDSLPLVEEDQVKEHLNKLDIQKSIGPDRMHLHLLMELANVTVRPLLIIIFEKSQCSGEVPEDWEKVNVTPIFKKAQGKGSRPALPQSLRR